MLFSHFFFATWYLFSSNSDLLRRVWVTLEGKVLSLDTPELLAKRRRVTTRSRGCTATGTHTRRRREHFFYVMQSAPFFHSLSSILFLFHSLFLLLMRSAVQCSSVQFTTPKLPPVSSSIPPIRPPGSELFGSIYAPHTRISTCVYSVWLSVLSAVLMPLSQRRNSSSFNCIFPRAFHFVRRRLYWLHCNSLAPEWHYINFQVQTERFFVLNWPMRWAKTQREGKWRGCQTWLNRAQPFFVLLFRLFQLVFPLFYPSCLQVFLSSGREAAKRRPDT